MFVWWGAESPRYFHTIVRRGLLIKELSKYSKHEGDWDGNQCQPKEYWLLSGVVGSWERLVFRIHSASRRRHLVTTGFVWNGKEANQVGESGEANPIWSAVQDL
jgi:hypothetical protein